MPDYYDEETDIYTEYRFWIEGIQVRFGDRWCPEATSSLYHWGRCGRGLLYTSVDCAKELLWTPPALIDLWIGVEIGYWAATRVTYDAQSEAHIAVTHTLSFGTSTVWLKAERYGEYMSPFDVDVRLCVEFANSEECTRFLHEDMTKLENTDIDDYPSDVGVIDDIICALSPLHDDYEIAERNAARRGVPHSKLCDEYRRPETQLIRHRGSNRGNDRPCFLTLHISTSSFFYISRVDWSATTIPSTFPSPSGAFQSLNNLHLKFPSHAPHDRHHDSPSQCHQDDLTITISAREISFLDGSNSISVGNSFSINSVHRTVNINYINAVMGDGYFGAISGGNVGGRGNHIHMELPSEPPSPPEHTRAQTLLLALARRRAQSRHQKPDLSVRKFGRPVKARTQRPRPY